MDLLDRRGAKVDYYDPHVPVIRPTREHPHWAGLKSISWSGDAVRQYDAVVIATAHDAVNYKQLGKWASTIVDTRNAMQSVPVPPDCKVWKAQEV